MEESIKSFEDLNMYAQSRIRSDVTSVRGSSAIDKLASIFSIHLELDARSNHPGILHFAAIYQKFSVFDLYRAIIKDESRLIQELQSIAIDVYLRARRSGVLYKWHNYITPQELALAHSLEGESGIEGLVDATFPYKPVLLSEKPETDVASVAAERARIGKIRVMGDYYGLRFMVPGYIILEVVLEPLDKNDNTVKDPRPIRPLPLIPGAPVGDRYTSIATSSNFPFVREPLCQATEW